MAMSGAPTMVDHAGGVDENTLDSELVPSSLASIAPILRVANEIEKENRRVAYLCRFHALEMAHRMDPTASGRGVRQFKTCLLHTLEREEEKTKPMLAKTDPKEIQKFYQNFYEKNIKDGRQTKKPEEMAKIYQIASVLYDALRTVVPPSKVDEQTQRYAKDVEEKREYYEHNNILPTVGVKPVIMELSKVDPVDGEDENTLDSELVPSSLASIAPILRVANEIEKENRRVAYLCRFHTFEMAHRIDPTASGRGVRQFKTYLLHRLKREEQETKLVLAKTDPREIQKFYQNFYEKNIRDGQQTKKPEEMAKIYEIASVLYDVLRTVVPPSKVDEQTQRYAKDVEEKKEYYEYNNILPTVGVKPVIMELSKVICS